MHHPDFKNAAHEPTGLTAIPPLHPRRWTLLRQRAFLVALAETGSVGMAARAAGMSRQAAYRLRARRPDLAPLWDMALRAAWTGRFAEEVTEGYTR